MPEYLAPGVYVEEVSFRPKTIEGVSTSTAGFIGPTRFGPINGEPELLTSYNEYERIYGGIDQLEYSKKMNNYIAHAVRAFFDNGGKRLYVSRVYKANSSDGRARATISDSTASPPRVITLRSRHPGAAGNVLVSFVFHVGQNILTSEPDTAFPENPPLPVLRGISNYDVVLVTSLSSPPASPPLESDKLYWVEREFDRDRQKYTYNFHSDDGHTFKLTSLKPDQYEVRILSVDVIFGSMGEFGEEQSWEGLSFHPDHRRALTKILASSEHPSSQTTDDLPINRATELYVPLEIYTSNLSNGVAIAETFLNQDLPEDESLPRTFKDVLIHKVYGRDNRDSEIPLVQSVLLRNGNDGVRPEADNYEGDDGGLSGRKSGIKAFEDLEDISIVTAPGSSYNYTNGYKTHTDTIIRHLISHCERMRYRIAVLDSADKQIISTVRNYRAQIDSKHAALYYPWVRILDPVTKQEINLPPSGFVAGIYARNDVENGVHKAPANEVVRGAIGFEMILNKAQQDVLNPDGINCFRFFEGRGYRLWGARTISSDPEWKYVNLRRYFAFLERSIEKGTQWVVFMNNSEPLWANVRRTVEDFLFNEWKSEHLMGTKPEEAYFVKCDRSTMTQNDLDNGRLVCLIGVAPVRPAEFVIFRIGQWTADRRG